MAQLALSWGYLGTFFASLEPTWPQNGHLEPSWRHLETKSFLETPVLICLCLRPADLGHFGAQNWLMFCNFGGIFLDKFFDIFWTTLGSFWGTRFGSDRPKRRQYGPRRPIKSLKKTCTRKNHKKPFVFQGFWGPRPSKTAWEGPRRLPRDTKRAPTALQKDPKMDPKRYHCFG